MRGWAQQAGPLAILSNSHSCHMIIPGRREATNPESRDSGFASSMRPGMTVCCLCPLGDNLFQQSHRPVRRRHVRRMAGVDLVVAPARFIFGALGEWTESVRGRDARGVDIA